MAGTMGEAWDFVPLFERRSKADSADCRGFQLTPQLSKVVERLIAHHCQQHFESAGAYGNQQFACRTSH